MARGKKKAADLSPEEKLKNALVPVEEQPYEVPENWCWVYSPHLFNIEYGKGLSTKQLTDSGYPVFGANGQIGYYSKYMFPVPKAIMSCRGAYSGVMNKTLPFSFITSNSLVLNPFIAEMDVDCIYYLFSALDTRKLVSGSAQPQVTVQAFSDYPIPLPPLLEQKRIVDCIKSIFAKLDEAKEKAQEVIDGFELRKSAILHRAFSGKLTANWRAEHGVGLDSWECRTLNSVCKSIFDGDHMPPPKSESGIPFLVISNVNTGYLSYENTRFVPEEYYKSLNKTRKPELGDVLYTLVGSYGIPVVVDNEKPFCFQRHMALLKPSEINTRFLWYLLQTSEMYNKATSIATGTAQLTVPIKGLRLLEFMRPSDDEQTEIVRILDNLRTKETAAKAAAEAVLDQIDTMKKAVLARAFRGELGTNVPEEESAVELLKSVL
ncbi:MAG: restriction endonuclease subunit S [Oscillospiraceae bacterium]|nr:restriction endonuclease subunit S [Oscillospiraceae bacterium]